MSFANDLRITLLFSVTGATLVALGLLIRADGGVGSSWLLLVSVGALQLGLAADGIQRRQRGDPRLRSDGPDERSLHAAIVGFAVLALVGAWSYLQGHRPGTWGVLLVGGLAGMGLIGWVYLIFRSS